MTIFWDLHNNIILFDQFKGQGKQTGIQIKTSRLCGLEIDYKSQLIFNGYKLYHAALFCKSVGLTHCDNV